MSVNTRVANKRGAASDVYSVLYSINKAEEEERHMVTPARCSSDMTAAKALAPGNSTSSWPQPRAQIPQTADRHTGDWRTTNRVCVCEERE